MYVLAVNGSPRRGGNTEMLLREVLNPLAAAGWETDFAQVGGTNIRGCLGCGKCFEMRNMECIVKTDSFNDLFLKMAKADAILLGSPTYFTDVSSEMKSLIDRSGYVSLANGTVFSGKIGAAVVAVRRAGAVHVYDTINHMFLMSQMIVPGSTYWNLGVGREKEEVKDDAEGLRNMKHLGATIGWLGKAIASHKESYPIPE